MVKKGIFSLMLALLVLLLAFGIGEGAMRNIPALQETPFEPYLRDRSHLLFKKKDALLEVRDWTMPKSPDTTRIAVIGDSFTMGDGVQPYDRFSERLEYLLNRHAGAGSAELKIYARNGTSTWQQVPLLGMALAEAPDLVVLAICLNDTEDWLNPGELFERLHAMLPRRPQGLIGFLTRHSKLAHRLYLRWEQHRAGPLFLDYYRHIYNPAYSGWQSFEQGIHVFKTQCAEAGIPLAVMVFPLLSHDLGEGRYPFTYCHEAIGRVLDKEQVSCLDIKEFFSGLNAKRLQAIPGLDPHPSEIAHRLAAENLHVFLVDRQFLPEKFFNPALYRKHESSHRFWYHLRDKLNGNWK